MDGGTDTDREDAAGVFQLVLVFIWNRMTLKDTYPPSGRSGAYLYLPTICRTDATSEDVLKSLKLW